MQYSMVRQCTAALGLAMIGTIVAFSETLPVCIDVAADKTTVPMGGSVSLDVQVSDARSAAPLASCLLLAYVNGRRWGAHEVTGEEGHGRIILPFPNVGPASVQVRALPGFRDTCIVWTKNAACENAFLATRFQETAPVDAARLRASANHTARIYLNGTLLAMAKGIDSATTTSVAPGLFRRGGNMLAVEAKKGTGIAGVAVQLEYMTDGRRRLLVTDRRWEAWEAPPAAWPEPVEKGQPVRVPGRLQDAVWKAAHFEDWPGGVRRDDLFAGRPLPGNATVSEPITVQVTRRMIPSRRDPDHLVGMQWGSYFFKEMFYWHNTQAVPMVGLYESYNPDVIRQHALWLMDMGVDFISADWPIYIPPAEDGSQHWENRSDAANLQIHSTEVTLEVYAQLRDEGYPAPQLVIMPFLGNGPVNSPETVNEELEWLHNHFIRNPRFKGLWVMVDGKPLIVLLHNTVVPAWEAFDTPIDDTHFTIRYMGAQLQLTKVDRHGYWSWMDGTPDPVVTYRDGVAEVCTPSAGFFGSRMWLADDAWGRRNGTTLIHTFKTALKHKPRFVLLHQWNEFTGQLEGYPYPGNLYGDTYSVELSDDIEPVSLTADGYRGDDGGWGYKSFNVAQALIALYKEREPETTVLAVYPPNPGQVVTANSLEVRWEVAGKKPDSFTLLLDNNLLAHGIRENSYSLALSRVVEGDHILTIIAEGARTKFPLARDHADVPLDTPVPLRVDTPFTLRKP